MVVPEVGPDIMAQEIFSAFADGTPMIISRIVLNEVVNVVFRDAIENELTGNIWRKLFLSVSVRRAIKVSTISKGMSFFVTDNIHSTRSTHRNLTTHSPMNF